jgi:hypothetical protein
MTVAQSIQVNIGKDLGTAIIGGYKVEVSPDSNVTVYTNDGVQTKPGAVGGVAAAKGTHISEDFNTVVLNGATIEKAADGHLVISTPGIVIAKSAPGGIVKQATPANDSAAKAKTAIGIGDLDDGGVYVGLSAQNGKPLHAALADLPDYKTYAEALAAAEQLKAAHPTAHVPSPKELDKNLFDNRNKGHLKGTFNTSGSDPGSVYRSSVSYLDFTATARVQWFDDGHLDYKSMGNRLPVRLVW